jgi:mercuric ion transport protein
MTIKKDSDVGRGPGAIAAASLLGAAAGSLCCVLPLILFGLGVSGAWIGNLARLAPYQPYVIAVTVACLGGGYWLVYRSSKVACTEGKVCIRPLPARLIKSALVVATALVVVALLVDYIVPILFDA